MNANKDGSTIPNWAAIKDAILKGLSSQGMLVNPRAGVQLDFLANLAFPGHEFRTRESASISVERIVRRLSDERIITNFGIGCYLTEKGLSLVAAISKKK